MTKLIFYQKMKSIQYNVALGMTGAVMSTSRRKPNQELGLKYL